MIFYMGVGLVALPVAMIRTRGRSKEERQQLDHELVVNEEASSAIKSKYSRKGAKKGRNYSSRDRKTLMKAEEDKRVLRRAQERIAEVEDGVLGKIAKVNIFPCIEL